MLQFVSPVHPIVPILNSLPGLLIHLNALQLHQGNGKLTVLSGMHLHRLPSHLGSRQAIFQRYGISP